jgi:enolase
MNDTITRIHAREVLDSRGTPTVEVEVHCADGSMGRAIVPSGASTGKHEAAELRDGDAKRYGGKGVRRAVQNVLTEIAPKLIGRSASDQGGIDRMMIDLDGTPNKSRLGANAILGVSLGVARVSASIQSSPLWHYLSNLAAGAWQTWLNLQDEVGRPLGRIIPPRDTPSLPLPMVNLISGGLHAGGNLDFQDFLFLPIGSRSYSEALEMTVEVYRTLGSVLKQHGFEGVLVGDEGGYGPKMPENDRAIEMILAAFAKTGLNAGKDAAIALDVASTHFYHDGRYHLRDAGGESLSSEEMAELLGSWANAYPILSIEDGLAEDDWAGWKILTSMLGKKIQLIGDDLFVTNPERLKRGIAEGVANAVLVKVNQIGTLTETLEVLRIAREAGYRTVISARSGETEDSTIADLAVGTGAGQIKIGSVARSERLAKYNQLLRIEEQMGSDAKFAGWTRVS